MNQKIRIKLRSYDHNLVDKSTEKIVKTVRNSGAVVTGPIPLPTEKKDFYRFAISARKQKISRAVSVAYPQTPYRNIHAYAENGRCIIQAGTAKWCGYPSQVDVILLLKPSCK